MTSPSRRAWALLASVSALGCATPSRHLTTRAVDDPMSLPRGLLAFSIDGAVDQLHPTGATTWIVAPRFAYGLTDRLELNRVGLRYAFLDDAPPPIAATPRRLLSLAARAGINGFGFSSSEGVIVLPQVLVDGRKHLGARAYVWGDVDWHAVWVSTPQPKAAAYTASLWPDASRTSELAVDVGGVIQLVNHLTMDASVGGHELYASTIPSWTSAARGLTVGLGPALRPRPWLSFFVGAYAGARWRSEGLMVVASPAEPTPNVTPGRVSWVGANATVAFFW
jgi:hypothetical protein